MTHDTPASFTMQGFGTAIQSDLLADKERLIRAASLEITARILQQSLEAEVTEEMGQSYAECIQGLSPTWVCRDCGTHDRRQFRRDGHYRRSLTVREGTVTLWMPLVQCRCKGYVAIPWQTVDPRARYWYDIDLDDVRHYLVGMSYRLVGDAASTQAQTNVSHVQAWRTMQEVGAQERVPVLGPCPHSVIFDEAYISVAGEKKVYLIAVADDARVLAVRGPTERTLANWQGLIEGLTEQGISPLNGLVGVTYDGDSAIRGAVQLVWPRVVLQQCVWHILERVADDVCAVHGPDAPEVERIVDQAARIFLRNRERPDAEERARLRLTQFLAEHGETAWAQTVGRAFDEGTEYLRTPGLQRTNGLAERTIKELRRRTKTMDGFKSRAGSMHFAVIWRVWKNMRTAMNKEQARLVRHRKANLKIRHVILS
jgi:Transposase, Mutator family